MSAADKHSTAAGPTLSVVIPVHDEARMLPASLPAIRAALDATRETYELLLVDDGSGDTTWAVLTAEAERSSDLRAIRLSRNFGKEAALAAGLEAARGGAVLVMDADLQHPPDLIPRMVAAWRSGAFDVVEAVKVRRGREPFLNRLGATLFYAILGRLSGFDLAGATDFKLLDRTVVDHWRRLPERALFFRGMILWVGLRRLQLPITLPERAGGESRWSLPKLVRLATNAITAFTAVPLHLVTLAGLAFLLFAVGLSAQTLWRKLSGTAVSGFATVIILELLIGSGVLLGLGVVGEYLSRIYEEVKGRPRYLIAEHIGPRGDPAADPGGRGLSDPGEA